MSLQYSYTQQRLGLFIIKFKYFPIFQQQTMELSRLNPDWQAAELHGLSTFPGLPNSSKESNKNLVCLCCLNKIDKVKAPLCQNSKQLQFLGFGFPLFYIFLKYCIILLLISIVSYNGIVLYWATINNQSKCQTLPNGCTSFMVKIAQISQQVENQELIIRIFSFFVQLGMLLYIRDLITKTINYYDERTCSLSDYSIMITNLPQRKGTRQNLIYFLKNHLDKPFNPLQITFLPESDKFYQIEEEKSKIIQQMKKLIIDEELNKSALVECQEELMKKDIQLKQYCQNYISLEENDLCITEKIIFSCQTEDVKDQILSMCQEISQEKFRQAFLVRPDEECDIQFVSAPEPKEINWEHINYPDHKRVFRMIVGWILTIAFLVCITIIFFFVLSQKSTLIGHSFQDAESETEYFIGLFLVYLALVFVILFNKFIMGYVLHQICDFERHSTTDEEQFHFAIKYSVGMFFTTALMTLAVEDIRFNNFYNRPYGLIQEQTIMFIMNCVFVPFLWIVNPWQIANLIKRKMNYGRKDLTQKEANKLMENVQYNMGKRYAEVIQIMWFTFLYSSLIPMGAFLSAIGLCLYYWIDKYNLLRKSSVNSSIAGELSLFSMKLLDFTLLCKPVGQLIFDSQLRNSYSIASFVMCSIAILYLVLPIDGFLNYFHPEKFKTIDKKFSQAEKIFTDTYQTLHPIFSLKKENQQKMFKQFLREDKDEDLDSLIQILPRQAEVKQVKGSSIAGIDPLRDATNVLKALFHRHNECNTIMKNASSKFTEK